MFGFTINLLVSELNMKSARKTELVEDLVCGMVLPIEKMPFKSTYKGKVYYFCSQGDKQIFDKYPNRWIKGVVKK